MGAKVMVVDDSALSRVLMRRILESGGYAVVEEADGISAIEAYALERPAVVVLDLVMKGMYGLEALVELRRLDPHVRVIVATADIQRATREDVMAAGACGFVSKPFVLEEVLRVVASALAAKGGTQ